MEFGSEPGPVHVEVGIERVGTVPVPIGGTAGVLGVSVVLVFVVFVVFVFAGAVGVVHESSGVALAQAQTFRQRIIINIKSLAT